MNANIKRIVGAILGLAIGLVLYFMAPPEGLTQQSMQVLGIFIGCVVWMIFSVLPEYIIGLLMCTLFGITGTTTLTQAFSGFGSSAFWMVWAAIIMGVGIAQTGIIARIALWVLGKFPPTLRGQTIAMMITGLIINPLIPAASSKVGIMAPYARAITDAMGYEPGSKGAQAMFAAFYLPVGCGHPLFLSASFQAFTFMALLSNRPDETMTWGFWLLNAVAWGAVLWIGGYIFIRLAYRPEHESTMTQADLNAKKKALGPVSRNEKIAAGVLIAAVLLFMTTSIHGISITFISLMAVVVLLVTGAMPTAVFNNKVSWSMLTFMGAILALTTVIPAVGIDQWLGDLMQPYLAPLLSRPALFLTVLVLCVYVVRLVIVSQTAVLVIFTVIANSLMAGTGLNPWMAGFCVFTSMGVFYLFYQATQFQTSYVTSGEMITRAQGSKLGIVYLILNLVGIWASIPLWRLTGIFFA